MSSSMSSLPFHSYVAFSLLVFSSARGCANIFPCRKLAPAKSGFSLAREEEISFFLSDSDLSPKSVFPNLGKCKICGLQLQ